jgi:hypothetical protein
LREEHFPEGTNDSASRSKEVSMKTQVAIASGARFVLAVVLLSGAAVAQPWHIKYTSHEPNAAAESSLYKRKADWQRIVDEFWGPGLPRSQKQQVFNTFADYIQAKFACFGGLKAGWDSLRGMYAQQINDSTSRGGFSSILTRLAHDLHEFHAMGWDAILQSTPLNPGTPIFSVGMKDIRHFGAALAPLPDSSLLVLHSVANHPLDLQPGDIILGYEGRPWKHLAFELLDSPLPRLGPMGSSESARIHRLLGAAGMNWHLFDTIDVVRYHSGMVEHLPTTPLSTLNIPEFMANNEQLPILGVPQPDYNPDHESNNVSYGVVQGTNIGYIYISGHNYDGVKTEFQNAVSALMGTDGLIIDIRWNHGGYVTAGPEAGLALLMNYSTQTLIGFERLSPGDLYALKPVAPTLLPFFVQADLHTLYDRPIAVLIGPYALSRGDFTTYQLRYLPSARFFGKPACGAVSGMISNEPTVNGFFFMVPYFVVADHREPDTLLARREFPLDEAVWFDKDDVAVGDDTVVKKAVGWITSVAYAHDAVASGRSFKPGTDTLYLTAQVENPKSHPISVMAYFKVDSTVVDSIAFADDGLNGDGAAGDGVWGTSWNLPVVEQFYSAGVRVIDPADPSTFLMPYVARFTTAGPVTCAGYSITSTDSVPNPGDRLTFKIKLMNNGSTMSIPTVTAGVTALDPGNIAGSNVQEYGDISPSAVALPTGALQIQFSSAHPGMYVARFAVDISSVGIRLWRDTMRVAITGIQQDEETLPTQFSLSQNYPNPFNPSTTVTYELPRASHVTLKVYDALGREVATLVHGLEEPGYKSVEWNASGMSSGVYLYRLTAGHFVQTRKLLVLR